MQDFNQNNTTSTEQKNTQGGAFSFLYRTRIKVCKGDITIVNLSLIFSILSLLSAPWLVVGGVVVSLVLGYRFSIEKNANGFAKSFQDVVSSAAGNVKAAVDAVVTENNDQE